jgi:trigger factor
MSATYTKKELPDSQVEVYGVMPYEDLLAFEAKALEKLAKEIEVDGFRRGQVPVSMARQYIQDLHLLEAMAEEALMKEYGDIIRTHMPDALTQPSVSIVKIARENPLEFKLNATVMPQITLPDYKKIAKEENTKKETVTITDEDVQKSLEELRTMRAKQNKNKDTHLHTHEDGSVHVEDGEHNGTNKNHNEVPSVEIKDEDLPELNDEFAQSFGEQFKTLDDLKSKIRENMQKEKDLMATDKVRTTIAEKIVEEMTVALPPVLIDSEIEKMMYRMESDLSNSGMKLDDYFKMINKTVDDIKLEWRPAAEKRVKLELALEEISKKESIMPDQETVNKEVEVLKNMYKDVDEMRARVYVESQLKTEKVFEFIDAQ